MNSGLLPAARPLGIGEVLDTGFRVFRLTVLRCLAFAAIASLAGQAPSAYEIAMDRPLEGFSSRDPVWWILWALGTFVSVAMWNAVLLRQRAVAYGEAPSGWADVVTAARRLPETVAAMLVSLLGIALGLVLLVLPGLYLLTSLSMTWPLVLFAGESPLSAPAASLRLVQRNWWRTTAIFAVGVAIVFVFYALGGLVGAVIALPLAGSSDVVVATAVAGVVLLLLGALALPLFSALMIVVWSDLTARRQGSDIAERIAAVESR